EKDNFWSMGDTGPCGPCSEIFFDRGSQYGCAAPLCGIGACDCDRWMEIWNLVFMQYDRDEEGVLTPLPQPSIDTGMGLERVASILQGKDSNYDIDLMRGIIRGVEELSGCTYDPGLKGFPFRVIADHVRAGAFLIADGITPSNEGRGYVLRRIVRRAARLGRQLGFMEPFLYRILPYVQQSLAEAYPELREKTQTITNAIRTEEERFNVTLSEGLHYAQGMIEKIQARGERHITGQNLFLLYDTYGFPLDLAKDIAEEHGLGIDEAGFEEAMAKQRSRARLARAQAGSADTVAPIAQLLTDISVGEFIGYNATKAEGQITSLVGSDLIKNSLSGQETGYITLSRSPFYAESGGQVGDSGKICGSSGWAQISDTQKLPNGLILHKAVIKQGIISVGDSVESQVDIIRRAAISRNHSATHLLHQALRRQLGEATHQAGSFVDSERLRFDFSTFSMLSADILRTVEKEVNQEILANLPISVQEMSLDEAKTAGALAFFGDKYGETVRVVRMGDYSSELCGGVHCSSTAEIGSLKIISEGGIGSGLRRIEAVTGQKALEYYEIQEQQLQNLAILLKTIPNDAQKRLESLLSEHKTLQKELEALRGNQAQDQISAILAKVQEKKGIKLLAAEVKAADMDALRTTVDLLRDKSPIAAILLAAQVEGKVNFVAFMSDEAQAIGLHAGKIIKQVAAVCGGGGGGQARLAQAGGKDSSPQKINQALILAEEIICGVISNLNEGVEQTTKDTP
ncbi:MAG: alanine--tRNA ligase, partial [Clostridiales bacterium]|nr:alanine--tRNA ligase [Clostridiales bacterium]